jgi:hypothetical protein
MPEDETLIQLMQAADLMDDRARSLMQVMERAMDGCDDDQLRAQIQAMHATAKEVHRTAQETRRRCEKRC